MGSAARAPFLRRGAAVAALALGLGAAPPPRVEWAFTLQDALQLPYLAPEGAKAHYAALQALTVLPSRAGDRHYLSEGDALALDHGADRNLKPGDRLLVLKTVARDLPSPRPPARALGDVVRQAGVVRVTTVLPQRAEAVVERCLDAVEAGDRLVPYAEPVRLPLSLRADTREPVALQPQPPMVVYLQEGRVASGQGDLLILDRGAQDGLRVGDVLLAVRPRASEGMNAYLGQVMVVRADARSATARVLRCLEELHAGDLLTR